MLKNYFKIAFRSFWYDRAFSVINLTGLSVGLAAVIMILGYIRYELSFDRFFSNSGLVYRLDKRQEKMAVELSSLTRNGTGEALKKEFPEIIAFTYVQPGKVPVKAANELIELNVFEGSPDFFRVFNLPFISGNTSSSLAMPHTLVLTERSAKKLFPGKNAVGQIIELNYGAVWRVTGVIKDIPANSHLGICDAIMSNAGREYTLHSGGRLLPQYVLLREGTSASALEEKFALIYKKYKFLDETSLELRRITDIHLYSHTYDEFSPGSDIKYIYIFSSAGLFILAIAVINYINLATARSVKRTLEVGVRKVLGADRKQLIFQFLSESFLFFLVALSVALLLARLAWPVFSAGMTTGKGAASLFDLTAVALLCLITVVCGTLSGIYPALFLSRIKPALSLKGRFNYPVHISFRQTLVVFQFIISGILIIATLVVQVQLKFINNSSLGFNKEQLVALPFQENWHHDIGAFKEELLTNPSIKAITVSSLEIGAAFREYNKKKDKKKQDTVNEPGIQYMENDMDFLRTMQVKLVAGRNFSGRYANDKITTDTLYYDAANPHKYDQVFMARSVILNETAVKQLKLTDPVGRQLMMGTVIGVVKDFNMGSFYQKIPPLILTCYPDKGYGQLYIRIAPADIPKTLQFIENRWKQFYPDELYNFSFVDEKLQKLYAAEQKLCTLFNIFSSLAILIACFGLFGLVAITVQQRVKEIGIRKVLGASVTSIVALLSGGFLKLVFVAMLIASPLAWWMMKQWLRGFAYQVPIEWWMFALATGFAVSIALITISAQAIRSALASPVKSLRTE